MVHQIPRSIRNLLHSLGGSSNRHRWTIPFRLTQFATLITISLTCLIATQSTLTAQTLETPAATSPTATSAAKPTRAAERSLKKQIAKKKQAAENMRTENLVAWCLVPFDAKKRGPAQRAQMLKELGLRKFAYDWRSEHIPTWDEELKQLRASGIELTAFWCSASLHPAENENNQKILDFLKRNQVQTQLWFMLPSGELDAIEDPQRRVTVAAQALRELAEAAKPLGCKVGLYNHGGWIGQPSSMVKVMEQLDELDNVGIVYNFHHAHDDLDAFPKALNDLKPYLMCLNLNGTSPKSPGVQPPKIQTLGQGSLDETIMQWIADSGYSGPIGILDHRPELDARQSLQSNIEGLRSLLAK